MVEVQELFFSKKKIFSQHFFLFLSRHLTNRMLNQMKSKKRNEWKNVPYLIESFEELIVVGMDYEQCTPLISSFLSPSLSNSNPTPPKEALWLCPLYFKLLGFLWEFVVSTELIVKDVSSGKCRVNDHFDMLDFCLRRYLEEITHTFPVLKKKTKNFEKKKIVGPVISEKWGELFPKRRWVTFNEFKDQLISSSSSSFKSYTNQTTFNFCFNFPKENVMTPYRLSILLSQFGPWKRVIHNFQKYACNPPFVGLMNVNQANNLIRKSSSTWVFLIRFSRGKPECLTVTMVEQKDKISNQRVKGVGELKTLLNRWYDQYPRLKSGRFHFDPLVGGPVKNLKHYVSESDRQYAIPVLDDDDFENQKREERAKQIAQEEERESKFCPWDDWFGAM